MSCKKAENLSDTIIIAHRGASGYLPEHTLPAKAMAYAMNPDYIEQDVVLSKDSVPLVIHDIYLDEVTNVAQVYPDRKRADGRYYVIDFNWLEIKQLLATERFDHETGKVVFPKRFPKDKSRFGLHTLLEEIELIQGLNKSTGLDIGIYPEIKNPAFHRKEGYDISKIVLDVLSAYGYMNKKDKCILQCFDFDELKRVREDLGSNLTLVQLTELKIDEDLWPMVATYADGVGMPYKFVLDKSFVKSAKNQGLMIHVFTLRTDQNKLWKPMFNEMISSRHIDGIFTDQPDQVLQFISEE